MKTRQKENQKITILGIRQMYSQDIFYSLQQAILGQKKISTKRQKLFLCADIYNFKMPLKKFRQV